MKKESKMWLELAQEDKIDMDVMMKALRYRGAILFAQQSVEKILKAYIIEKNGLNPRRIHAIEELLKDAELDLSEIGNPNVKELTKAYTRVRYTDLSDKYYKNKSDVEKLLKVADTIYKWIEQKLTQN